MTRKDYELIAAAVKTCADNCEKMGEPNVLLGVEDVAHKLANELANENERFDHGRFLAACGF